MSPPLPLAELDLARVGLCVWGLKGLLAGYRAIAPHGHHGWLGFERYLPHGIQPSNFWVHKVENHLGTTRLKKAIGTKLPAIGKKLPAIGKKLPAIGTKLPAIGKKLPAIRYESG